MSWFEKLQTVIMLAAIGLGLAAGRFIPGAEALSALITPALMAMLFGLFLGISLDNLKGGFQDVKFISTSLAVNFLWIPALGWGLGSLFLADSPALFLGYLMLLVTPCTDWYLVFTGLARGNVPLSAALLPINLLVQVLLLPVYLLVFTGLIGRLDWELLARSVVLTLVLPFGLALAVRRFSAQGRPARRRLERIFTGGQFWFLCLAIAAMFASQAGRLTNQHGLFVKLFVPVALFFVINFGVGRLVARLLKFSFADSVSLSLTTLARNSPISLAIAVTTFPDEPLIALALVIGPLIELPFLTIISQALRWLDPRPSA